jgi:hypothetical protein
MYSILYTSSENYEDEINYNVIKDETNNICLICWLPSHDNSIILKMKEYPNINTICNCNAEFHVSCIKEWFDKTQSCPICRKQITIYKPDLTNNYITSITYFICCFNFCISVLRVATIISLINIFLLITYNCYFMVYIKPKQDFLCEYY